MPLLDRIFSVVAPHACLVCGNEGNLLCAWCLPDAFAALPSRCYKCQRATSNSATCKKCFHAAHTPRYVWVVTDYEATAKKLIHSFKFKHVRDGAAIISRSMCNTLPYLQPETLIVPIPTATARIRQRGYDHAQLLARQLATNQKLQWQRVLSRVSQSRQVGSDRKQRFAQLKDAFIVSRPNLVKGVDILLVDDVVTTGATLEAATACLKNAGAKSVNAVVFAAKAP